jgi:ABC-type cobalamin transport system permease subunit
VFTGVAGRLRAVLDMDRALIAWLRRHHVPLDAAFIVGGGIAIWLLSMTISTYKDFYLSARAWLPGVGVAVALVAGLVGAVVAHRGEVKHGDVDRLMKVTARVALVGAVLLLQMAPMAVSAA